MAEDKKEEITPEVKPDIKVETPLQVSIEDLQKQLQDRDSKILEQQRTISRHAESERKLKDQSEAVIALRDDFEEYRATSLDYLEELRGQPVEEAKTPRSHRAELEEQRKARAGEKKAPQDPDVTRFITYIDSQELKPDDPLVLEAVGEDRTPQEALKYLRDKVKANSQASTEKSAAEIAKGLHEQWLKEHGLTAPGAGGPSASAKNWRDLSAKEKIDYAIAGKK